MEAYLFVRYYAQQLMRLGQNHISFMDLSIMLCGNSWAHSVSHTASPRHPPSSAPSACRYFTRIIICCTLMLEIVFGSFPSSTVQMCVRWVWWRRGRRKCVLHQAGITCAKRGPKPDKLPRLLSAIGWPGELEMPTLVCLGCTQVCLLVCVCVRMWVRACECKWMRKVRWMISICYKCF